MELLSEAEPPRLESLDRLSHPGEQGLLCSSTRVASLLSEAVPKEMGDTYTSKKLSLGCLISGKWLFYFVA
jgi:hypothetical protein